MHWKKRRLLEDFRPLLDNERYCREQLSDPYHHYREEGSIEFYVERDSDNIPVVGGVEWSGNMIDVEKGDWGVHDQLFPSDALAFDEFVRVVAKVTDACIEGDDPAVDLDGDYMRVWHPGFGATPPDAVHDANTTAAEALAQEKGVGPFSQP